MGEMIMPRYQEQLPVLPDTDLRTWDVFVRDGRSVGLKPLQTWRCPCGSVYTRASLQYLSCDSCHRVWEIEGLEIRPEETLVEERDPPMPSYGYWEKRSKATERLVLSLYETLRDLLPEERKLNLDLWYIEWQETLQALEEHYGDVER